MLYVIGASGCGKDSLIRHARTALERHPHVVFAHRYITRAHDAGGENHVALSEAEFEARVKSKLLSLHWQSHGFHYGIGCELNQWLAKGMTVIMNGSRAYLAEASARYPELVPVLIEVSHAELRSRLMARGRESETEIEARLSRAGGFARLNHAKLLRFSNNDALHVTGPAFVELILAQTMVVTCV